MTTLSWCDFFQKKPRNVRHATWTSATGNGMSLLIWYWSTKKVVLSERGQLEQQSAHKQRGKTILPSRPTEMFEAQVPLHNIPLHQGSRGNNW